MQNGEASPKHNPKYSNSERKELLMTTKYLSPNHQSKNHIPHALHEAKEWSYHSNWLRNYERDNTMPTLTNKVNEPEESQSTFCTSSSNGIPITWILLDNQSTIDVFANPKLLKNIRSSKEIMQIHSVGGVSQTNMIGDLPGYGTVWYHKGGIANILSLSRVCNKGYTVTYSSAEGNEFTVLKKDGTKRIFKQSERGLFYLDTTQDKVSSSVLITTVTDKQYKYSNRDHSQALLARKIQKIIGRPSTGHFLKIVSNNLLPNCPVTYHDIMAAEDILGPDIGSLKGKTVRKTPDAVKVNKMHVPKSLSERYHEVIVTADIMYINKVMFLVTISRHLRFATSQMIINQKGTTIMGSLKQVLNLYHGRNFKVTHFLMDGQFEPLRNEISSMGVSLNTVAREEHVPEIERHIRTLKERVRSVYNTLPFKSMPDRMMIELVYYCTFWLNSFPNESGVSETLSPRTIVTGESIDYTKHCKLEFGEYVQTHEEHDNTMVARTVGAIALRPTGNYQGSYVFYSLNTGRTIVRNQWTSIPMPEEVIKRVEDMSTNENERWLDKDSTEDDEDEPIIKYDKADDVEAENEAEDIGAIPLNDMNIAAELVEPVDNEFEPPRLDEPINEDMEDRNELEDDQMIMQNAQMNEIDNEVENQNLNEIDARENEPDIITDDDENIDVEHEMDAKYGPRTNNYDLRPRKLRNYSHLHATLDHFSLTQYNLKRGLEVFGNEGILAVKKELQQLHERDVLIPVNADKLGTEMRRQALPYLMFLKQKRTGQIKGRGCDDGRRQRLYHNKEDASSPTVTLESVMITSAIDAKEGRDVATVDIPGAFMQAEMDELVYMKIEGSMVDLLVELEPEKYKQFVTFGTKGKILYVKLKKALYGTLRAALLFWKKLSTQLQEWGFKINKYDQCVANKMMNGKQCTIIWHVDDLKISHVDEKVVSEVIEQIAGVFGAEAPLTINRGKVHDYLGMNLDFSIAGKVTIGMQNYVKSILKEVPDDMMGVANTPASSFLFLVNNQSPDVLDSATADMFHTLVAKLLFLSKRSRPDIQLAVAFLCTRVTRPDADDYKKLTRVIKYLRQTEDMALTIECDSLLVTKWWVDASFGCHEDLKSHTGGMMSLGKGAIYATSTRQKLNTRSSTEGELVAVHDVLPQILWTRNFLIDQGFKLHNNLLFQDNQIAILLENNGRGSSSKRTRHIDIRYFFIKDRVDKDEVKIEYCNTDTMIADFFTKPLQGARFTELRNKILNINTSMSAPPTEMWNAHRSVLDTVEKVPYGNDNKKFKQLLTDV